MKNKAENFDFMAIIMNRDLFSGTICQCGGVARGPKVHFSCAENSEKGVALPQWLLLLTCECFAPGTGHTQPQSPGHGDGFGYGYMLGWEKGEIRATICEIRVEHKIALSMVSLSSTEDEGQDEGELKIPRPYPIQIPSGCSQVEN